MTTYPAPPDLQEQYNDAVNHASLVRSFPDLSRWALRALLAEHGDLIVQLRGAQAGHLTADRNDLIALIGEDMGRIVDELERRTGAEAAGTAPAESLPVSTYVRRTVERCTEATREPGQESGVWHTVHLLGVVGWLAAAGHGAAVVEAADAQARDYGLRPQSEVEQGCVR